MCQSESVSPLCCHPFGLTSHQCCQSRVTFRPGGSNSAEKISLGNILSPVPYVICTPVSRVINLYDAILLSADHLQKS
jgi:hypothetical protein